MNKEDLWAEKKTEEIWSRVMTQKGFIDPTILYKKAKCFGIKKNIVDKWMSEYRTLHNKIKEEGKGGLSKNYEPLDFVIDLHSMICLDQITYWASKEFGEALKVWGDRFIELSKLNEALRKKY